MHGENAWAEQQLAHPDATGGLALVRNLEHLRSYVRHVAGLMFEYFLLSHGDDLQRARISDIQLAALHIVSKLASMLHRWRTRHSHPKLP